MSEAPPVREIGPGEHACEVVQQDGSDCPHVSTWEWRPAIHGDWSLREPFYLCDECHKLLLSVDVKSGIDLTEFQPLK
jgi:hypothetical protein